MSESDVLFFSKNAPKKYKVYTIPKRTSGQRVIAHPSKELKEVQKKLSQILASDLKSHEEAYAYKKGLSIKDNAEQHLNTKYLLKYNSIIRFI